MTELKELTPEQRNKELDTELVETREKLSFLSK